MILVTGAQVVTEMWIESDSVAVQRRLDPKVGQGLYLAPKQVVDQMQIRVWHPIGLDPNADQRATSHFAEMFNFESNLEGLIDKIKRQITHETYKKLNNLFNEPKINSYGVLNQKL